jgi:hypothetical protein
LKLILLSPALLLGDFGWMALIFWPFAHDLYDLSDIGTFAFLAAGVESVSIAAIAGAVFSIRLAFRKYRAVIEVPEKARRNSNGGLTGQMIKKKIAQLKITEINLITDKIEQIVCQEFFAGKPGIVAAGTFFKN